MSFRGHVPPVQYPVAGQQQQQYSPQPQQQQQPQQPQQYSPQPSQYDNAQYVPRRPSFDNGDDSNYFAGQPAQRQPSVGQRSEDELFLSGAAEPQPATIPIIPAKPPAYGGPPPLNTTTGALSGFQHQYQAAPATPSYNPLAFVRPQSQTLPYHPHPSAQISSPSVTTMPSFPSPQQNYTPPTYNPAAYANTSPNVPQRMSTYSGYSSYQHSYSVPPHPQAASYAIQQQATTTSVYRSPSQTQQSPAPPAQPAYQAQQTQQVQQQQVQQQQQQQQYQPGSYYGSTTSATGMSPQPTSYEQQYSSSYSASSNTYTTQQTSAYQSNGTSPLPTASPAATAPTSVSSSSYALPSTMTSQAPYPAYSVQDTDTYPTTTPADQNTYGNRVSRSGSSASPLSSPFQPPLPAGLQRHPTNAPLPHRPPMEDVLEEPSWQQGQSGGDEHLTQDSLIQDIEADLGIGSTGSNGANGFGAGTTNAQLPIRQNGDTSDDDLFQQTSRGSSTQPGSAWSGSASMGDQPSSTASTPSSGFTAAPSAYRWEDDSDPEGAFGVYEMQQADLDEQRFSISGASMTSGRSGGSVSTASRFGSFSDHHHGSVSSIPPNANPLPPPPEENSPSDSEFVGMDIGLFSGGYAGNLTYGNQVGSASVGGADQLGTSPGHVDYNNLPKSTTPRPYESETQYAPFLDAEVDYGGTGGLQAPVVHRLSYDDGDDRVSVHSGRSARSGRSGRSGSESPYKEDYPDMFYHPGLSNRPLPALPSVPSDNNLLSAAHASSAGRPPYQHSYSLSADSRPNAYYSQQEAQSAQAYQQQLQVERSTSMSSHSTTPVVQVPGRSRTDAADERRKAARQLAAQQGVAYDPAYEPTTPTSLPYDVITLPSGRRRKFVPSKLVPADFRRCYEPWALSSIARWIREMADGEPDLKRKTIEEGLVVLFTTKVPNMNVADAETLAAIVTDSMFAAGILIPEEEWVKFGPGEISGVLWQLTGQGCYAPRVHEHETTGRCYSYHCTRTLKKANLDAIMSEKSVKKEDWVTHYKITKAIIEGKPKKEVERQNVLHEIVTSEEEFNSQLDVLRVLYREQLRHWQPPIIAPNRLERFLSTVFGKVETMQAVNRDHLLAPLKYRQNEQGPWIVGFSDIFREWIRKAKDEYIAYSTTYPNASFTVRKEASRNMFFRQFLDYVRGQKQSDRLGWDTFLKAPITRLQRYSLLLSTVLKNTPHDSEEKTNLVKAIEEIRAVTKECDRLVDEMGKKVSLQELQNQLVFRQGSQTVLNLDHLGRELLMQGDLQRMGSKGVRWVDTHALLFDHYFILAKAISTKEGRGDKKYDVSKEPIPMPLLLLESMNDEPIAKQKGITAPLARTAAASASDTRLNKVLSNGSSRPELEHSATGSSINSISRLAPGTPTEEGKILYPFRVKHLGHEIYTLYATSPQSRQDWCNKIIEAKTRHARALLEQNAEPFRLRVIADTGFAYDSVSAMGKAPGVSIRGTPLDRAIREMEQVFGPGRGPPPVSRSTVNCSAGFSVYGKSIIAVGTDFGVYIADASNPRGWTRTVQISKVTQLAVLEEFSICLVLADKALISYPLDTVAPVSNFPAPTHETARRAPQRLAKDVSFFATARMKDRMLLFYKRKEGMHNTFKVLEPVFQKATEKKTRFFSGRKSGAGSTESFRDFDEFYLPIECFSLNLFQSYVAVSTAKGIEMLTLDRKQTMSVPRDLSMPAIANIAARIREQRPLGMFRLNDQEFLLAYEDCAVYSDKHGEVSRTLIMEYSGKQKKAKAATMFGQYLLLFNEDYVEVRNAENGRLRQIIAGYDMRCLDYGFRGPTGGDNASATATSAADAGQDSKGTVKICMTHPEVVGMQIVLELQLNDGHAEKV